MRGSTVQAVLTTRSRSKRRFVSFVRFSENTSTGGTVTRNSLSAGGGTRTTVKRFLFLRHFADDGAETFGVFGKFADDGCHAFDKEESRFARFDDVVGFERDRAFDAFAVDEGAVARVVVGEDVVEVGGRDGEMLSRHFGVVNLCGRFVATPDGERFSLQDPLLDKGAVFVFLNEVGHGNASVCVASRSAMLKKNLAAKDANGANGKFKVRSVSRRWMRQRTASIVLAVEIFPAADSANETLGAR